MKTLRMLVSGLSVAFVADCCAQSTATDPAPSLTFPQQLLMEERPPHLTPAQWEAIVRNPMNASVFPIHIDAAMVDTIPASWWDQRYHYVLVPKRRQAASKSAEPAVR